MIAIWELKEEKLALIFFCNSPESYFVQDPEVENSIKQHHYRGSCPLSTLF